MEKSINPGDEGIFERLIYGMRTNHFNSLDIFLEKKCIDFMQWPKQQIQDEIIIKDTGSHVVHFEL